LIELTLEQLAQGRLKALQNAIDLIEDAECLIQRERWARANFLAHIAIEELGKYLMLIGAIGRILHGQIDWSRFWKRFFSHAEKTRNIFDFDALLSPSVSPDEIQKVLEKSTADSEKYQEQKMSSLYVDFENDQFVAPTDIFDKDLANRTVEAARSVLTFFETGEKSFFSKGDVTKISPEKFKQMEQKLFAHSEEVLWA